MSTPRRGGQLTGRVALVTGAASNIGRASAIAIADAGGRVLAADCDAAGLEDTARRVRAEHGDRAVATRVADLGEPDVPAELVDAAVAEHGALDLVVHGAVDYGRGRIEELTVAQWDRAHAVNARAAVWLVRAAAPHLEAGGHGSVVLFSSIQAQRGTSGTVLYAATKGAIESMTRHLAVELAPQGIRVNAISPGHVVPTPPADRPPLPDYPLGRLGRPEEIASVVVFLGSDGAGWMTGSIVPVDGGLATVHPSLVASRARGQGNGTGVWRQRARGYRRRLRRLGGSGGSPR